MGDYEIDDVDVQLLDLLQENARYTAIELAERIGVSDNTIHNRMERLAEEGVITGYTATIDHSRAGLDMAIQFTCTAPISERPAVASEILEIPVVVEVTELLSGRANLLVTVVVADDEEASRVAARLDEVVEIADEHLIRSTDTRPLPYSSVLGTDATVD